MKGEKRGRAKPVCLTRMRKVNKWKRAQEKKKKKKTKRAGGQFAIKGAVPGGKIMGQKGAKGYTTRVKRNLEVNSRRRANTAGGEELIGAESSRTSNGNKIT